MPPLTISQKNAPVEESFTVPPTQPIAAPPKPIREEFKAVPDMPVAPITPQQAAAPIEEKMSEEEAVVAVPSNQKKKQTKLSYEELDKKLDEIINNDLF